MKTSAIGLIIVTSALLAGCATYQWRHGTRYDANFEQESYECKQEAAKALPPQIGERITRPTQFISPQWHCPAGVSDRSKCNYTPGRWLQAERESYDLNASARNDLYNSCLKARGWLYLRVD